LDEEMLPCVLEAYFFSSSASYRLGENILSTSELQQERIFPNAGKKSMNPFK
jgi:hypothetical protein